MAFPFWQFLILKPRKEIAAQHINEGIFVFLKNLSEAAHNKSANNILQAGFLPVRYFCTMRKLLQLPYDMVKVLLGHERTSQNKLFHADFPKRPINTECFSLLAEMI